MLLSIMGMFTTSAFAEVVRATNIFSNSINVNSNAINSVANGIDSAICIENGVTVLCSTVVETNRTQAPYDIIDAEFLLTDFTQGKVIRVVQDQVRTIDPGVYKLIQVEAAGEHKPGSQPGELTMNPGVYWIDEYIVNGQVASSGANGTVTLIVKSTFDLNNSNINCKAGSFYQDPNRFAIYTEAANANIDGACISGYMYFKNALNNAKMDLWGAISAESVTLDASTKINVDLDHLIFTNFDAFLEIGPNMTAGWHMVKAPAEINATNQVTVADFFGDDLDTSTFRTDWRVYERNYSGSGSYYTELDDLNMTLDRNRGYWLGTKKGADLKVLGLNPVVWDRKIEGCPTKNKGCYRYELQRCADGDRSPYLHNLVGAVGSIKSDWKDYRIEVDENGTLMTPQAASESGIMSNQIWKYSPSVTSTGTYVTGDDVGHGDSTIDYFEGFWVEVNCTNRIGKKIDLIIPNGKIK